MSNSPATRTKPRVLAALSADTSPLGMTHGEIVAATGLRATPATSALRGLRKDGKCFALGALHDSRYFASAERMEACRPAWDAFMAQLKIQRRQRELERERITSRAYYARRKAEGRLPPPVRKPRAARPPKPPRPVKAAAPKKPKAAKKLNARRVLARQPVLKAPVEIRKPREVLPVIVPAHVRVQVCPCGKDQRYSVPADHVGEFVREWRERRA